MQTTIFDSPLREFKTLKSAMKWVDRYTVPCEIRVLCKSFFDSQWPKNRKVYAIFAKK